MGQLYNREVLSSLNFTYLKNFDNSPMFDTCNAI